MAKESIITLINPASEITEVLRGLSTFRTSKRIARKSSFGFCEPKARKPKSPKALVQAHMPGSHSIHRTARDITRKNSFGFYEQKARKPESPKAHALIFSNGCTAC
jgi:hypothetical protein